jgi:small subunit ribosomal protein S17
MSKKIGKVVFIKDFATARIEVQTRSVHAKYKKVIRSTKCFLCGIKVDDLAVNDIVEISSCRPISKCKSHIVTGIISKSQVLS